MAIHECRTYTPNGKLKRVDSAEKCREMFWTKGAVGVVDFHPNLQKSDRYRKRYTRLCKFCKETFIATNDRAQKCHKKVCKKAYEKSRCRAKAHNSGIK